MNPLINNNRPVSIYSNNNNNSASTCLYKLQAYFKMSLPFFLLFLPFRESSSSSSRWYSLSKSGLIHALTWRKYPKLPYFFSVYFACFRFEHLQYLYRQKYANIVICCSIWVANLHMSSSQIEMVARISDSIFSFSSLFASARHSSEMRIWNFNFSCVAKSAICFISSHFD